MARRGGIPRGQRPQACTEATCARTGRSCGHPREYDWVASRSLRTYDDDERPQEVGQTRSSDEVLEQGRRTGGGEDGAKGSGQREDATAKHGPDTGPDHRAKCAGADTTSSSEGSEAEVHRPDAPHLQPEHVARSLLRAEARCCPGSRWGNVAGVRREAGEKSRGPLRATETGGIPSKAGA